MTSRVAPTAADQLQAMRIALSGIAAGMSIGKLNGELEPLHPANDTFPGEVLLDLAAVAIQEAGASREAPIAFEGIREQYLPECGAHTKEQHYKSEFAIRAAAMIRAGVDPDLLDEIVWWRIDDLWMWAVDALVVYVRVAADRTGVDVAEICERLARRRGIDLGTPN